MKKFLLVLLFIPFILRGEFLDDLQSIDNLLQKGLYVEALSKVKTLLDTDLSEDDRLAVENLRGKIEEKIKSGDDENKLFNNTGQINFKTEEANATDNLESISSGTVAYPGDEINDSTKFSELSKLESEVLGTNSSDNIYALMKIYIKSGLYEKAMKLGMKDGDLRNIYLSAKAARLIGKNDIAIAQYKKVLSASPTHLGSLLGIGIAYRAKGDKSNAVRYFNAYLSNGGQNPNVAKTIQYLSR